MTDQTGIVGRDAPIEDRLIVGLDLPSVDAARALVDRLGDSVRFYKIGLQLQFVGGIDFAAELIADGRKIFLDTKLFDIEQTVAGATESIARLGVHFLTVHGIGPTPAAAVRGRGDSGLKLLAVTVLTNFDADDIRRMGYARDLADLVLLRARESVAAGVDGIVASGAEAARLREALGEGPVIVTPGVRSAGVPHGDQKRVVTPAEAIAGGADYIVAAREVTQAADPKAAVRRLQDDIHTAFAARTA